jgi:hypothetical protein
MPEAYLDALVDRLHLLLAQSQCPGNHDNQRECGESRQATSHDSLRIVWLILSSRVGQLLTVARPLVISDGDAWPT